ncbi:hypothetical protein C8Q76DRAFT_798565 [Earliella scabrosa]|nr:hypothetical protein C8Q76DRAFT_798565 [Earliella scabrosa]
MSIATVAPGSAPVPVATLASATILTNIGSIPTSTPLPASPIAPLTQHELATKLEQSLGAYLIGTYFGVLLYGLGVHQTYRYFRLFPTDTKLIRTSVIAVMLLQTIHTVFTIHTCYHYFVSHFGNGRFLTFGVWSLNWIPLVMAVTMFVSQIFFARRVSLIGSPYRWITFVAMFFFVVEIGFAIATVYQAQQHADGFWNLDVVNHFLTAIFGSAAIGDTLLTGSLIIVLRRSRRVDVRRTESVLHVAGVYIINTGLLHDILNVTSLVLAIIFSHELIHASIGNVTTRLYANTLLAVLNTRKLSTTRDIEVFNGGDGMNVIARANRQAAQERWNVPQVADNAPSAIHIAVMTEMASDKAMTEKEMAGSKDYKDSV